MDNLDDYKIVQWADYGEHIPLRCKCGRAYSTKNIDFIGARTIFSKLRIPPCVCPMRHLAPDESAWIAQQVLAT